MYVMDMNRERRNTMTTLSIVEARNRLAEAINRVSYGGERVVLARREMVVLRAGHGRGDQ